MSNDERVFIMVIRGVLPGHRVSIPGEIGIPFRPVTNAVTSN